MLTSREGPSILIEEVVTNWHRLASLPTARAAPDRYRARIPPLRCHSVFRYSISAVRSASVSTSVNSWPVFDWLYMRVL
jgi:hypothetical protein